METRRKEPSIGAPVAGVTRSPETYGQPQMNTNTGKGDGAPAWMVWSIFSVFLVWGYFYLTRVRPAMNQWLAQYISGYPAMLHLIPILGVPIAVAAVLQIFFLKK